MSVENKIKVELLRAKEEVKELALMGNDRKVMVVIILLLCDIITFLIWPEFILIIGLITFILIFCLLMMNIKINKVQNNMNQHQVRERLCKSCGMRLRREDSFCSNCGCKLTLENKDNLLAIKGNDNMLVKIFIFILLGVLIIGFYVSNYEITQNNIMQNNIIRNELAVETQKSEELIARVGEINGKNVILRSIPSTLGSEVALLYDNTRVDILGKETCKDKSAAILDISSMRIYLNNGKEVTIYKGQALTVIREQSKNLLCSLKIDGNDIIIEIAKTKVRFLEGSIWYKIKTKNGFVGYVFCDYIKELI